MSVKKLFSMFCIALLFSMSKFFFAMGTTQVSSVEEEGGRTVIVIKVNAKSSENDYAKKKAKQDELRRWFYEGYEEDQKKNKDDKFDLLQF